MIVKIQISLMTTEKQKTMLIYNRSRSVLYQAPADKDVLEIMKGRPKAYFNAIINKATKFIEIQNEVNDQLW